MNGALVDTADLVERFRRDPSSPYNMTMDELQTLLAEVGEQEPVVDAILRLGGAPDTERAAQLGVSVEDINWDDDKPAPKYWLCEECGHEDRIRPMPEDRTKFYARIEKRGSPKCPECKSIGFMPKGF
jgi:hypothetical protein